MKRLMTLAIPAIAVAALIQAPPAHAFDMAQMEQFAPVLEVMKQRMGKRQFQQVMQIGAAAMPMMESSGFDLATMSSGMDLGSMAPVIRRMGGIESLPGLLPRGTLKRRAR